MAAAALLDRESGGNDGAKGKQHLITLFSPVDGTTVQFPCNLVTLTLSELRDAAGQMVGEAELLFNGQPLGDDGRALDAGLGNGSVVVVQAKGAGVPMGGMLPMLQMYQMALANHMQLASLSPSPPLTFQPAPAVMAAGPPPSIPSRSASPVVSSGDITAEFCTYALTSDGSRALINALTSLPNAHDTVEQLIPLIIPKFLVLATHQHASKVVTAIAKVASPVQVAQLVSVALNDIKELCDSNAGSEVLVTLANQADGAPCFCNPDNGVHSLAEAIAANVVHFCTSVNGRKVVQTMLATLPNCKAAPLFDSAEANLVTLATDQCGCITLQRMYDYLSDDSLKSQMQIQLFEHAPHLITDPFGNYVLQHVVKDCQLFCQWTANMVKGHLLQYAVNKFASNVIECCLQTGSDEVRKVLIHDICHPTVLEQLMKDNYGNYVVQSAVENSPVGLLDMVKDAILPLTPSSPYGYRIETKLQKRLKSCGRNWNGRNHQSHHPHHHQHHQQQSRKTRRKATAENTAPSTPNSLSFALGAQLKDVLFPNGASSFPTVRMPLQQLPQENALPHPITKP